MSKRKRNIINQYLSSNSYKTANGGEIKHWKKLYISFNLSKTVLLQWLKLFIFKGIISFDCQMSCLHIFHYFEKAGFKFELNGLDNLKNINCPVVFVANHMSFIETLILPGILMKYVPLSIVAKQELKKLPFLSSILNSINTIYVSRKNKREDYIQLNYKSSILIRKGYSLLIFPEGKRFSKFNPNRFRKIGLRIAVNNKICLMPIAIKSDAWESGGKINPEKIIHFEFGNAFYPEKCDLTTHEEILGFINKNLAIWDLIPTFTNS